MADVTAASIKAFIAKSGGKVVIIHFDNDQYWFFLEDDDKLTDNMFETVGGIEYIKRKGLISSQRYATRSKNETTGKTEYSGVGYGKKDIVVWTYKPVADIQGIMYLENIEDLPYIDKGALKLGI